MPSFGWGDYGLSMALDKAPFNDVRVRQALSMAINRDIVAEVINKGDAALYGPFPWALAGYTKRTDYSYANLGPNYQYNPKEARRSWPRPAIRTASTSSWSGPSSRAGPTASSCSSSRASSTTSACA